MVKSLLQILLLSFPFLLAAQEPSNNCQNCKDFQRFLQSGKTYFENTDFDQALIEFQAAQVAARICGCSSTEPATLIEDCITGIQQQKDDAISALAEAKAQRKIAEQKEKQAQRNARASQNALAALKLEESDHTQALRLAEMNYHLFPESHAAAGVLQNLLGKATKTYYNSDRLAHHADINDATFSSDGQFVVTASNDHSAILWDTTGRMIHRFEGHSAPIHNITFSPNGKLIASVGAEGEALLWDKSGKIIKKWEEGFESFYGVDFSLNGQFLAMGTSNGKVILWDLKKEKEIIFDSNHEAISDLAFSPDGKTIITCGLEEDAILWDLKGKKVNAFEKYPVQVAEVAFSFDGQKVLTANRAQNLYLLRQLNGEVIKQFPKEELIFGTSLAFSPDGETIAYSKDIKSITLYNFKTEITHTLPLKGYIINSIQFSPDGSALLVAAQDGTATIINLDGKIRRRFGIKNSIFYSALSTKDLELLLSNWDGKSYLWNYLKDNYPVLIDHKINGLRYFFTRDEVLQFIYKKDNQLNWVDSSGKIKHSFSGLKDRILAMSISPDEQFIVAAYSNKRAILWSIDGTRIKTLSYFDERVVGINFSSDGTKFLTGTDRGTAYLWDTEGHFIKKVEGMFGSATNLTFSPDGKYFFVGCTSKNNFYYGPEVDLIRAKLCLTDSLFESPIRVHQTGINAAKFLKDSKHVITGDEDGKISIWNLSGKPILNIKINQSINQLVLPESESTFTTISGYEEEVRMWSLEAKMSRKTFNGHLGYIYDYDFSPDGKILATAANDAKVALWNITKQPVDTSSIHDEIHIEIQPAITVVESKTSTLDSNLNQVIFEESLIELVDPPPSYLGWFQGHKEAVNHVVFSQDGSVLLSASTEPALILWDTSFQVIQNYLGPDTSYSAIAIAPAQRHVLAGTVDGRIYLWERSGKLLFESNQHKRSVKKVRFSPDGKYFLTVDENNISILWDANGTQIETFKGLKHWSPILKFSPNGRYLFVGNIHNTPHKIRDLKNNTSVRLEENLKKIALVIFSPDNKKLLVSDGLKNSFLFDKNGNLHHQYNKYQGKISNIGFSSNNKFYYVADDSGPVFIWDINGHLIHQISVPFRREVVIPSNGMEIRSINDLFSLRSTIELTQEALPWLYFKKFVSPFTLSKLQALGLQFTQEDLEQMNRQGKQW